MKRYYSNLISASIYIFFIFILSISIHHNSYSKCSTHIRMHLNNDSLKKEQRKNSKIQGEIRYERDFLHKYVDTPNKRFRLHYDTTGNESVPTIDLNNNKIPDYIDSAIYYIEYVYDYYINNQGYIDPTLKDTINSNGDFKTVGGNEYYDIYFRQLGMVDSSIVGFGVGEYGFVSNESIYKQTLKNVQQTSYMVLDNDYSVNDLKPSTINENKYVKSYGQTKGIAALKITIAHEFHHSIQMITAINNMELSEMISTYFEWRLFPEIKDYYQYLNALLIGQSFTFLRSLTQISDGYHFSTYGQYLYLNYGDTFFSEYWNSLKGEKNDFLYLDDLLKTKGSSLQNSWCEYANWFHYIGDDYVENKYFPDAKYFPKIKPYESIFFDKTLSHTLPLRPLSLNFYTVIFKGNNYTSYDTLNLTISNTDLESLISYNYTNTQRYFLDILDEPSNNFTQLSNSKYYYKLDYPESICYQKYYYNGKETDFVLNTTPNPFNNNSDELLLFPTISELPLFTKVAIKLYSLDYLKVFETIRDINILNDKRGVILNKNEMNLSDGIYLFNIEYKEDVSIGKFVILSK